LADPAILLAPARPATMPKVADLGELPIRRDQVLTIMGALADLLVEVRAVRALLEEDDEEEEEGPEGAG
jgi:hypothetical protein